MRRLTTNLEFNIRKPYLGVNNSSNSAFKSFFIHKILVHQKNFEKSEKFKDFFSRIRNPYTNRWPMIGASFELFRCPSDSWKLRRNRTSKERKWPRARKRRRHPSDKHFQWKSVCVRRSFPVGSHIFLTFFFVATGKLCARHSSQPLIVWLERKKNKLSNKNKT